MVKKKTARRTRATKIVDDKEYQALIPQIIEASGNFLNNVKNPFFVGFVIVVLAGAFFLHKYFGVIVNMRSDMSTQNQITIKRNVLEKEQNELLKKQNDLIQQQNKSLDDLSKKGFKLNKDFKH
jgi:cell division protein FtsB